MIYFSKKLQERIETDIFIAGGGPAGIAAAVAAAEQGSRVFLSEAGGCFGGSSTQALVPEIMNFDDGINFLCGGIGRRVYEELFSDEEPVNHRWYVVQSEKIKRLYDSMIENSGIDFLFFSKVVDVITDRNFHVTHAIISGPKGLYAVKAKVFIDCSGSGSICALAGAEYEYGGPNGEKAAATLCSVWGGIDFSRKNVVFDGEMIEKAYADGVFSQYDGLLCGIKPTDPQHGIGGGNVGHCFDVDDTDDRSLTAAMLYGRKSMLEYEKYYRGYLQGFENATLEQTANVLGIRESRRIIGDIKLTINHYKARQSFEDEIGRYFYPIDIHPETPDRKGMENFCRNVSMQYEDGESYGIPYRALTPRKLQNMLVAGRCISADRYMQASVRVIPCCYITGQAAGIAAAVSTFENKSIHDIQVRNIQERLKKLGAYLPNF